MIDQQLDEGIAWPPLEVEEVAAERRSGELQLLTLRELMERPSPEWLIDGVLPEGGFVLLYSQPGVGKTFLALDMACSIASSCEWLGRAAKDGSVVYVAAEGVGGLAKRLAAWSGGAVDPHSHLGARFFTLAQSLDLFQEEAVDCLLDELRAFDDLRLVVFDTFARCNSGEENSASDMGRVVRAVDRIREETGATVLMVHHAGKADEGERGSSAIRGAVDCVMRLKDAGAGRLTLACTKQKEAAEFDDIHLILEAVSLRGDLSGTSLRVANVSEIVSRRDTASGRDSGHVLEGNPGHVHAKLLDTFGANGATAGELEEACGLPHSTFHLVLRDLKEGDYVRWKSEGKHTRYWAAERSSDDQVQRVQTCPETCPGAEDDVSNVSIPPKGDGHVRTRHQGEPEDSEESERREL